MEEINVFKTLISNENLMTELFSYFFNFKVFRESFLKLLGNDKNIIFDYCDIETQYHTSSSGIPDIAIINDDLHIFFEIKINDSTLTNHQLEGYIEYLKKQQELIEKEKWLIFLVPKNYKYIGLIKDKGFEEKPRIINGGINGLIIYWSDIIKIIEDNQLECLNWNFKDFHGLLKMWYEIEEINFEPGEIEYLFAKHIIDASENDANLTNDEAEAMTQTNLIAKSFPKLIKLIDVIKSSTTCKSKYSKFSDIHGEYGLYFKDSDENDILFFGIWFPFWEKRNKPLCFGVHKEYDLQVIKKFRKRYPGNVPFEGWFLYWIEKEIYFKDTIKEIKKEIDELLNYLSSGKN